MATPEVAEEDKGKKELFVGRINSNTQEDDLRAMFKPFGTLIKCKHLSFKGVAFIEYESHEEAARA